MIDFFGGMHCQIDSGTFLLAICTASPDSQFFVQYKLKSLMESK